MLQKKFLITILVLISLSTFSQITNPVTVNLVLTPPHSAILSEYTSIGSNKLIANIRLNDLSEPLWNVRLKISIESSQVRISTKINYKPPTPIELLPGTVIQISGEDLAPYLSYANIDVQGITMYELQQNGIIPEGFYTFTIEVYDYNSNRLLSNTANFNALVQLNGVPLVQNPSVGRVIIHTSPLNIPLQWQLSSPSIYGDPSSIEYQLSLYKILDPNVNPVNSIINNVVEKIYESDFSNATSLVYGLNDHPLEVGQKYSYTVQARDVDGRDIFKNKGFSEVGWFYYGYPANGNIAIRTPENRKAFSITEFKRFWWDKPDNIQNDQQVSYRMKIVELGENQDSINAINNNPVWYEYSSLAQIGSNGYDFMLNQPLTQQEKYAWQVKAYTGEQEIAKSEVRTFIGPPVIEKFMAGNHECIVTKTNNSDLSNLSGSCRVKISENAEFVEFNFEHLNIGNSGGENVLLSGQMTAEIENEKTILLEPDFADNGNALFYAEQYRLDKNALLIKGNIRWTFPIATDQTDLAVVQTKSDWVNFNSYKLLGSVSLGTQNQFNLIDPIGYHIAFDSTANFLVSENKFTLRLFGKLSLPEDIVDNQGNRMVLPFRNINNLFYFEQENVNCDNNILLADNTKLQMKPLDWVVDFSETETLTEINPVLSWKGIAITRYRVIIPENVDENSYFSLSYPLEFEKSLADNPNLKNWID
ncbi:MAG: hypothetical protein PHE56_14555, partial [Bacteroidales bacterium]|nr:hypothetical protein [Bacteroidales bacterium]